MTTQRGADGLCQVASSAISCEAAVDVAALPRGEEPLHDREAHARTPRSAGRTCCA